MRENSPGVHHKMIVSSCKAKEPLILIQYITGRSNSIRAQNWQLSDWPPWYSFELLQWFIAMNASCTRTGTPLVIKLQRREHTNSWLNGQMNIGKHVRPSHSLYLHVLPRIRCHEYMIAVKFLEKLHIVHQICSLLGNKESLVRRSTIITMEKRNGIHFWV